MTRLTRCLFLLIHNKQLILILFFFSKVVEEHKKLMQQFTDVLAQEHHCQTIIRKQCIRSVTYTTKYM